MTLSVSLSLSSTESLAEVTGLSTAIVRRDHIKVLPGKWKWSADDTFPPISCVLATQFWSADFYKTVREELLQPIPNPDVVVGGEFITVETQQRSRVSQAPSKQCPNPDIEAYSEASEPDSDIAVPALRPTAERRSSSQPPAQEIPKCGVIHLVGMKPGSVVPASLKDLEYSLVVIEVSEADSGASVHSFVARLVNSCDRIMVAIMGDRISCGDARAALQSDVVREQLKCCSVRVYRPEPNTSPYQFGEQELLLITRINCGFKACTPFIVVCESLAKGSKGHPFEVLRWDTQSRLV